MKLLLVGVFLCVACGDDSAAPDASSEDASSVDSSTDSSIDAPRSDVPTIDAPLRDTAIPRDGGSFTPNPMLADLAAGSAIDLGTFACTGVGGEEPELCRRTTDYSGFVYDPHRHEMVAFGGGHATTMTDSIHVLDLSGSLTWSDLYPPTPCGDMTSDNLDEENGAWLSGPEGPFPRPVSTHTYDMLAVPPGLDEFVVISRLFTGGYCHDVGNGIGGTIAHFDRADETWSFSSARGDTYDIAVNIPGSEADPISGDIVLLGIGGLALYDPSSRTYEQIIDTASGGSFVDSEGAFVDVSEVGYSIELVYFPPHDAFYLFPIGDSNVYALRLNRDAPAMSTLDRIATTGPRSGHGEPSFDYDSTNQVIGGAVQNSRFYELDPTTATWTEHVIEGNPGNQAFHALRYDPVNNVFIFVTDYDSGQHTWAFRLR